MSPDDLDPRDPFDETLARGLGALAPSEFDFDADAALGSMRPAFHRARARRRLAIASSALGLVVVLAAGAVVLQEQPSSHVNIESRTHPSGRTPTSTKPKSATSTTRRAVVPPPTSPQASTTTVPGNGNGNGNGGSVPISTPTSPVSTPTTPNTHGGSTPATVAPQTTTYTSAGGKAVIRFANGRLTLVSYSPAPGYTTEIHTQKPDDVELRFSNPKGEWRIRVRVQNGRVEPEITQH